VTFLMNDSKDNMVIFVDLICRNKILQTLIDSLFSFFVIKTNF